MNDFPFLADMRRLGLSGQCSAEDLKAAWRRAVSELHPDRPGSDQSARAAAMSEVNAAYQRLRDFEAKHGRLPAPPKYMDPRAKGQAAPAAGRWRKTAILLATIVAVTLVLWPQTQREEAVVPIQNVEADPWPKARAQPQPGTEHLVMEIDVGTKKDDVLRLAGRPLFQSEGIWDYGPSEVRFEHGLVVRWHSSPLRPLPVSNDRTMRSRADNQGKTP